MRKWNSSTLVNLQEIIVIKLIGNIINIYVLITFITTSNLSIFSNILKIYCSLILFNCIFEMASLHNAPD